MEPANEPIPSDRLEPGISGRNGLMHGCVQAILCANDIAASDAGDVGISMQLRPMRLLEAAACLATSLESGVTVLLTAEGNTLVLEDGALATLARTRSISPCVAVRMQCPDVGFVESSDVRAIADAVRRGQRPIEADVRARWSLQSEAGGIELVAPRASIALPLLAESIARYAADRLGEPRCDITPPEPDLVERLMAISGSALIRPKETQVWASFIEIGVCVDREGRERPCELALLYDRPSGSWHMEP
jgi:hypothetical protein